MKADLSRMRLVYTVGLFEEYPSMESGVENVAPEKTYW
jgi:hypothetical protein